MNKLLILSLFGILLLIGCNKDNDPKIENCLPKSMIINYDSLVFDYSTTNVLNKLVYYRGYKFQTYIETDELEHDTEGKLIKLTRYYANHVPYLAYSFTYANGVPIQVDMSAPYLSTDITRSVVYSHDTNGRIAQITFKTGYGAFISSIRYEYNDQGNVTKSYTNYNFNLPSSSSPPPVSNEKIGIETIAFDNHERFYSASKDLKIINEYLYLYIPNKNNCLSLKLSSMLSAGGSLTTFGSPITINYLTTYDSKNMIQNFQLDSRMSSQGYSSDLFFNRITYNCK